MVFHRGFHCRDNLEKDDSVLFKYSDMYYLHCKDESMGEQMYMEGRETEWGSAISRTPFGPYIISECNPVKQWS